MKFNMIIHSLKKIEPYIYIYIKKNVSNNKKGLFHLSQNPGQKARYEKSKSRTLNDKTLTK